MKKWLAPVAAVSALAVGASAQPLPSKVTFVTNAPSSYPAQLYSVTSPIPRLRWTLRAPANPPATNESAASPQPVSAQPVSLPKPVFGPVSGSLDAASRAAAWANLELNEGTEPFKASLAKAVFDGKRWVWRARVGYGQGDVVVTVFLDELGAPRVELFRWVSFNTQLF
jgi:hypothetical protein